MVDQHSLDIAARITPLEVDTKVAKALLGAVTAAALASELASRDASISRLQASKADASALTAYALQSTVDTSSEVDSKSSGPPGRRHHGGPGRRPPRQSYATNAALSASKTALQSALDAILAELAALQLSGMLTRRPGRASQLGSLLLHGGH